MKRILLPLALGFGAAVQAGVAPASIDDFIAREMPASGAPGLAYAIVTDGRIHADARGEVLAGSGRQVTSETPFLLGSVSKSFTAIAVMQLVEAGDVDLDGGVSKYLKVFSGRPSGSITIRQLLSHTSGFSTLQGNQSRQDHTSANDGLSLQVERIAHWDTAYEPGTRWEYSNANYQVLGALIEIVSGQEYARYVETRILKPIGMNHSFVADGNRHESMARGHRPWFGAKRPMGESDTDRVTAPQGGVIASANDVATYLAIMMNGQDDIISARSKLAMLHPASAVSPFYGLGWFIDAQKGTAFHTGASPGIETIATLIPAERKGVVVLVNAGSGIGFGETAQLRDGITARALGLEYPTENSRWQQKAVFVLCVLLPVGFVLSMAWAWIRRDRLRAKRGAFGLFSLWFPLFTTLGMAWILFFLIPRVFGVSIATLRLFQPDLALTFLAMAVTGIGWAVFRLCVAFSGKAGSN